jgi:hypothetical protein
MGKHCRISQAPSGASATGAHVGGPIAHTRRDCTRHGTTPARATSSPIGRFPHTPFRMAVRGPRLKPLSGPTGPRCAVARPPGRGASFSAVSTNLVEPAASRWPKRPTARPKMGVSVLDARCKFLQYAIHHLQRPGKALATCVFCESKQNKITPSPYDRALLASSYGPERQTIRRKPVICDSFL